ncbi:MAG: hypothetical protein HKO64_04705 [Xanthomonadales bacterium]|nr:hypothetical protein [Xanthomonadales bacterium]NNL94899.1 hypothetical protein [Xanthomonadales bacterium]
MDFSIKKVLLTVAVLMTIVSSNLVAKGGYVELPGDFDDSSNNITNPWWPQPSGQTQVFLEEADDECVVGVVQVIATANQSRATVDGIKVREIWDREYIDNSPESCDGNLGDNGDWELTESTFDWYAEDIHGNVWYYGERSVATDHDECDHETDGVDPVIGLEGCLDGSWEAGYDIWEEQPDEDILAGIIMLASPEKGQFYFQEYWEDEATDMGKVLNFKDVETALFGDQQGCLVTKEWVPLEPGNVEHKYYCYGHGLVLVEGNAGGKTVWTDLVNVIDP